MKGEKGEQIIRKSGQTETRTKALKNIRGSHYSALVINKTIQRSKTIEANVRSAAERKEIFSAISQPDKQFREERTDATIEEYSQVLLADTTPVPNAMQQQSGTDLTTHMKNEVPYSTLRIVHIPLVREELIFRGEIFDEKESIKALVTRLKESDMQAQKILIEADTGNTNPDKNELNTKVFLPLCQSAESYFVLSS